MQVPYTARISIAGNLHLLPHVVRGSYCSENQSGVLTKLAFSFKKNYVTFRKIIIITKHSTQQQSFLYSDAFAVKKCLF